jgi:hypothetical protein
MKRMMTWDIYKRLELCTEFLIFVVDFYLWTRRAWFIRSVKWHEFKMKGGHGQGWGWMLSVDGIFAAHPTRK